MAGGKGGKQTTEIPEWVAEPAKANLARAQEAAQIGYTPYYGPSVAAFSPMQQQAFANLGSAGQAFGLAPQGEMFQSTLQPTDFGGGLMAHSSGPLYDLALQELQARMPGQFDAINNMFLDPLTGRPRQAQQAQPAQPGGNSQWGMPQSEWSGGEGNPGSWGGGAAPAAGGYQGAYDQQMASLTGGRGISMGGGNTAAQAMSNAQGGTATLGGLLGGLFGGRV